MSGESGTIRLLEQALASSGGKGRRRVRVGIGDDAAVIQAGRGELVWTVDTCVEGERSHKPGHARDNQLTHAAHYPGSVTLPGSPPGRDTIGRGAAGIKVRGD